MATLGLQCKKNEIQVMHRLVLIILVKAQQNVRCFIFIAHLLIKCLKWLHMMQDCILYLHISSCSWNCNVRNIQAQPPFNSLRLSPAVYQPTRHEQTHEQIAGCNLQPRVHCWMIFNSISGVFCS